MKGASAALCLQTLSTPDGLARVTALLAAESFPTRTACDGHLCQNFRVLDPRGQCRKQDRPLGHQMIWAGFTRLGTKTQTYEHLIALRQSNNLYGN